MYSIESVKINARLTI